MSGKGENVGGIGAQANPSEPQFPIEPSQPMIFPFPSSMIVPIVPAVSTISIPVTSSSLAIAGPVPTAPLTLTRIVTLTNSHALSAQSTVAPRKTATITSTISVSDARKGEKDTNTNIAGIIFGIMVGLVIIGGSIAIVIRRKFSKNKENKRNQPQNPSVDPITEVPEIISDDQISRRNTLLYFHPQFPLPPPRHPLPQSRLPQYSPQNPPIALYTNSSSTNNTRNYSTEPSLSDHSAYTEAIPNYYQKYSQIPLQTATNVTSSHSEQSQFSSVEIPE